MFQKKKENNSISEKKPFVIPQIPKRAIDLYRKKDGYNPTQFVSPIFGKSVLDKTVVLGFNSDGDIRKKYNAFRDEKIPIEGEDEYKDFDSVLISNQTRAEIFPGAKVIENSNEETEVNQPVPEVKLSFVKENKPVEVKVKDNYTEPFYGQMTSNEEKITVNPTPKKTEMEPVFNYGNDSFSDVPFERFSLPKYEEPVYTRSRFSEPEPVKNNSLDNNLGFNEPKPIFTPKPTYTSEPMAEDEEEVIYHEEITIGNVNNNDFIRSGEFGFRLEEPEPEDEESSFTDAIENPEYVHSVRTDRYENYHLPPVSLLRKKDLDKDARPEWVQDQIDIINSTLIQFDIDGEVSNFTKGPTVTRYEIKLKPGVHVKKVSNISDNLKMALAAKAIRIEAPIPGKPNVGIEVPNKVREAVCFGNIIDTDEFMKSTNPLKVAVGLNIDGEAVYNDIAKMPHGLIAGTTGSGKSVCVNGFLISLLLKNSPKELKLMLVDPKMVEFATYNEIPHLVTPVINDPKIASEGLKWCVAEMDRRYLLLSSCRAKDIISYNEKAKANPGMEYMPYIVVVIDELADLMMVASSDVEDSIKRLTAKSRACGIHLLIATQRPTTDVVKGTIKANIPTRFALRVSSIPDSVTILNQMGAESLLGHGDMLINEADNPYRVQGAYVTSDEIDAITDFIRNQAPSDYLFSHESLVETQSSSGGNGGGDPLFIKAAQFAVENGSASANRLQKELNVGFNRAQRLLELLKEHGIVASAANGAKGNLALLTPRELDEMIKNGLR